jgi:hypothetical protein
LRSVRGMKVYAAKEPKSGVELFLFLLFRYLPLNKLNGILIGKTC